jgi:hypothetical protein
MLDHLINLIAEAKKRLVITEITEPQSVARRAELRRFGAAIVEPRRLVKEVQARGQEVPHAVLVELRVCELAIDKLRAA